MVYYAKLTTAQDAFRPIPGLGCNLRENGELQLHAHSCNETCSCDCGWLITVPKFYALFYHVFKVNRLLPGKVHLLFRISDPSPVIMAFLTCHSTSPSSFPPIPPGLVPVQLIPFCLILFRLPYKLLTVIHYSVTVFKNIIC